MNINLTYILNDNKIAIIHTAKAEEETFFNITNHSYFNLNGHESFIRNNIKGGKKSVIVPRHYENIHVLHENTMPNRSYYIPAVGK